jgi:hypothetical protein
VQANAPATFLHLAEIRDAQGQLVGAGDRQASGSKTDDDERDQQHPDDQV